MIIFRYLFRETILSMSAVTVVVLLILMSGRFVKYLGSAAAGELAGSILFSLMWFRLPSFIELVLPLGLFIGVLLAYGRLYVDSEMVVMSACGVSQRRLSAYVLGPGLVVMLIIALLALYLTPLGHSKVRELITDPENTSGINVLVAGRFQKSKSGLRVSYAKNVRKREGKLEEVFLAERTNPEKKDELSVLFAQGGEIIYRGGEPYLEFNNGTRYNGRPGTADFQITDFDNFGQKLVSGKKRESSKLELDARTTQSLYAEQSPKAVGTLFWRASMITLVPIVALLALGMSRTTARKGRYIKMLPAILLYLFYLVGISVLRTRIEDEKITFMAAMITIHGLYFMIALLSVYGLKVFTLKGLLR